MAQVLLVTPFLLPNQESPVTEKWWAQTIHWCNITTSHYRVVTRAHCMCAAYETKNHSRWNGNGAPPHTESVLLPLQYFSTLFQGFEVLLSIRLIASIINTNMECTAIIIISHRTSNNYYRSKYSTLHYVETIPMSTTRTTRHWGGYCWEPEMQTGQQQGYQIIYSKTRTGRCRKMLWCWMHWGGVE